MRLAAFALLSSVLVAGCASEGASLDPASALDAGSVGAWNLTAEGTMGWVAAFGTHAFFADLIVGVRSHDQCPEVSFALPPGATELVITLSGGVALANVAISGPGEITYVQELAAGGLEFSEAEPASGVWNVEIKPTGATAAETRALAVSIAGEGAEPEPLFLQPDGDCLL